jgi:hypothetical protein
MVILASGYTATAMTAEHRAAALSSIGWDTEPQIICTRCNGFVMPKPGRFFWRFKVMRIGSDNSEPIGTICCETLAEAFKLARLTWKKGVWHIIPNGKTKT